MNEEKQFSCSACTALGCSRQAIELPADCLGGGIDLKHSLDLYKNDLFISKISKAAADVDVTLTRVQETVAFAQKIGAKKVGIAACIALIKEAKTFAEILDTNEIENFCVNCKIGSIEKSEIGFIGKGRLCNPISQAEILNRQETDLNVMIGLCVGHDALFTKYSNAPVTTLVVKDRVLKHNPVAGL